MDKMYTTSVAYSGIYTSEIGLQHRKNNNIIIVLLVIKRVQLDGHSNSSSDGVVFSTGGREGGRVLNTYFHFNIS